MPFGTEIGADSNQFQGMFERAMGIATKGRNVYDKWLAARWQEAAQNWAMQRSGDLLNLRNVDAGIEFDNQAGIGATQLEFENWVKANRDNADVLFGSDAGVGRSVGDGTTKSSNLNILSGLSQGAQTDLQADFDRLLTGTGVSGKSVLNEAFLNDQQRRFGRRGGRASTDLAIGAAADAAYRAWQLDDGLTGMNAPARGIYEAGGGSVPEGFSDTQSSFLNQRLNMLRNKYNF